MSGGIDSIVGEADDLEEIAGQMRRGGNKRQPNTSGRISRGDGPMPPRGKGSRPFAVLRRGKPKPVTLAERA